MKIEDIKIGDIAMLKHGRGFIRVDEISRYEIRQRSDSGCRTWVDVDLVESVGTFVVRSDLSAQMPTYRDPRTHGLIDGENE